MIELRGLEVEAGDFRVGPVDLEAADGEYAVLLGPSGAGKSLVLEAVAGVRPVAAGEVRLAGADVTGLAPERRRAGLVFQDGLLFPHLTVAKNIAYGMRGAGGSDAGPPARPGGGSGAGSAGGSGARRGAGPAGGPEKGSAGGPHGGPAAGSGGGPGRAARVEELAAAVGVEGLLDRRPATLSGGERQRVALARALAAGPRVLLLDEPLSAVDTEAREALQDLLRRVCRERLLPVLHVTHDRDEAFALADRCHVLVGGRMHQQGRPLDVLRRPADAAVARFLGARNLLPARRDPHDPLVAVLDGGGKLGVAAQLPDGGLVLVVRPEDLHLSATSSPGALIASVTRLTLQGGHVLVGLEAPARLEALVPAGELEQAGIRVGHTIAVSVRPADVHVLPADVRVPPSG